MRTYGRTDIHTSQKTLKTHSFWMGNGFYTLHFQYLNSYNFHSGEIIRLSRVAVVPKNNLRARFIAIHTLVNRPNVCSTLQRVETCSRIYSFRSTDWRIQYGCQQNKRWIISTISYKNFIHYYFDFLFYDWWNITLRKKYSDFYNTCHIVTTLFYSKSCYIIVVFTVIMIDTTIIQYSLLKNIESLTIFWINKKAICISTTKRYSGNIYLHFSQCILYRNFYQADNNFLLWIQ